MKQAKMTIQEIKRKLGEADVSEEWVLQLESDERKGVQRLLARWKRQRERERLLRQKWQEMSRFERFYREQGLEPIAGVDEVGRGPLAGPVVAAAVILPHDCYIRGLNDSKKLTPPERERLFVEIDRMAVAWATSAVPAQRIDEINIYRASLEAMSLAVRQLTPQPHVLLNDAVVLPDLEVVQEKIVDGDEKSISVAAASIVAKVTRDRLMKRLGELYPQYGFERNMGYATAEHLEALKRYGPTAEHRRSFAPVRDCVARAT